MLPNHRALNCLGLAFLRNCKLWFSRDVKSIITYNPFAIIPLSWKSNSWISSSTTTTAALPQQQEQHSIKSYKYYHPFQNSKHWILPYPLLHHRFIIIILIVVGTTKTTTIIIIPTTGTTILVLLSRRRFLPINCVNCSNRVHGWRTCPCGIVDWPMIICCVSLHPHYKHHPKHCNFWV